jgi:hypothetical protein
MKEGEEMLRTARRALAMLAASGLVALTMLACVQPPALVIENSTGDVVPLETWTATISSSAAPLRGTATLSPGATYRETRATITLSGAAPRAVHAWHVQPGECGHDPGILGGPQWYTPLTADDQGDARSTVTLPFTVPTSGRYFVSVRQSASDSSPIVACGNLTKDRSVGGPTIAEAPSP